jgi:hypothetical protein
MIIALKEVFYNVLNLKDISTFKMSFIVRKHILLKSIIVFLAKTIVRNIIVVRLVLYKAKYPRSVWPEFQISMYCCG